MLSEKAAKILTLLLSNDKAPLTIRQIAAMTELSERSISTYLKEVYTYCRAQDIPFINKPGLGILLNAGNQKTKLLQELSFSEKSYYTSEYRVNYIISLLLNNWTSYTMALFAEDLAVSKTTVENDLKEAARQLETFEITIIKKAGSGICLSGRETDIRRAIVSVNRRFYKTTKRKLPPIRDYRLSEQTIRRLFDTYRSCDLSYYVELIQRVNRLGQRPLTDRGFESMLEYLMVAHSRVKLGFVVEEGIWKDNPHDRYRIDEYLSPIIQELHLPKPEWGYLELIVSCMEYQSSAKRMNELFEHPIPDILTFTKEIIQYVSHLIGLDFTKDLLLLKTLYYYNRSALPRVEYGIELPNPFLDDIKKTYPAIFSACFAAGALYQKKTGRAPTENELSYLSLLVGGAVVRSDKKLNAVVLCAAGIGTSQIVARKIEDRIPQINVVNTLSFFELSELPIIHPHLVISTIANIQCDYPVVYVSPVLSNEDIRNINRACSALYTKAGTIPGQNSILSLLHDGLISLEQEGQSKEKVLRSMAQTLLEAGIVEEGFLENVLAREQLGSTALGGGVAIPHSIAGLVTTPAVSLMRLKQSIDWDGEPVDMVFMLALNFDDISITKLFFKAFYAMTSSPDTMELLRQAKTPEEIKSVLQDNCL